MDPVNNNINHDSIKKGFAIAGLVLSVATLAAGVALPMIGDIGLSRAACLGVAAGVITAGVTGGALSGTAVQFLFKPLKRSSFENRQPWETIEVEDLN